MARTNALVDKRIDYLFALAKRWSTEERYEDARTAIKDLRLLAMKHTRTITEIKRSVCKECDTLLVAGRTCTVRLRRGRRVITCNHCNTIKRL